MNLIKGKLARVLFGAMSVLLAFCMTFTGCGVESKKKLEKGFDNHRKGPILVGVTAESDTFETEAVTLDLQYGVYDLGYYQENGVNPKNSYIFQGMGEYLVFGVYVCGADGYSNALCGDLISDYKTIDNHTYIKSIEEKDAFSEEYGYIPQNEKSVSYNHFEKIKIPKDIFADEEGTFAIKIIGFQMPVTPDGYYHVSRIGHVDLDYQMINDNTVKIIFSLYDRIY